MSHRPQIPRTQVDLVRDCSIQFEKCVRITPAGLLMPNHDMAAVHLAKDLSELQDAFCSLVAIKLYTSICFCFEVQIENAISRENIVSTLRKGLAELSTHFPWLSAQVIIESGTCRMIPFEQTCRLLVNDMTATEYASYAALKAARFPSSMLDGTQLGPMTESSTLALPEEEGVAPVFLVQASFLRGGLLLNVMGEHSAMDGQGLGQIVSMLSRLCHGEQLSADETAQGNRRRTDIVPLLDEETYQPGPELVHHQVDPANAKPFPSLPDCKWHFYHFSKAALSKLKTEAATTASVTDSRVPLITTNDAITAFIWQTVARVRAGRFPAKSKSMLVRAIDARPVLSIPSNYLGNLHHHTYTSVDFAELTSSSLGQVAATMRAALEPAELLYSIQSLASVMTYSEDRSLIRYGADLDISKDIWFSSWAKLPCYHHDFNLGLGLPDAVRRPRFGGLETLMYLLPMDREGGIDAALCLREEDLLALKSDRRWTEYADWIG